MLPMGLTVPELRTLSSLLVSPHHINVRLQVLDLNHNYLSDISKRLVEGQVDIDCTGSISRSLKLNLFDPDHYVSMDTSSPNDGALFMDRMMRVVYNVHDPVTGFSVDMPSFCGPIRKLERNGIFLSVEAQGKEVLSIPTAWRLRTYKAGMKKTSLIFSLLYETGERQMDIPDLNPRISSDVAIGNKTSPWSLARTLAASMGYILYYDGRGIARMRPMPQTPVYTFTENALRSQPVITYDLAKVVNAVEVLSQPPKGGLGITIRRQRVAPWVHPLSPARLGRNGVPLYLPKIIQNNNLKTIAEVEALAESELEAGLIESIAVTADALPIPFLEPYDVCRLSTRTTSAAFRLFKMSLPLTAKGTSPIGYNRRVTPKLSAIRPRRLQRR